SDHTRRQTERCEIDGGARRWLVRQQPSLHFSRKLQIPLQSLLLERAAGQACVLDHEREHFGGTAENLLFRCCVSFTALRRANQKNTDDLILRTQRDCQPCIGVRQCLDLFRMPRTELTGPAFPSLEKAGTKVERMPVMPQPIQKNVVCGQR